MHAITCCSHCCSAGWREVDAGMRTLPEVDRAGLVAATAGCRYSCQFAAPSRLCHTIPAAHSGEVTAQVSHQLAHAERILQLAALPRQAASMRRAVGSNPPRAAQTAADPRPQRARKRRRHHPSNTDAADDAAPIFCFCLCGQLQQFSMNALMGGL